MDLTLMNKRRYGGFIIHLGVVLVFAGIIGSSFFKSEQLFTVATGEEFSIGDYTLKYKQLTFRKDPEKEVVFAHIAVFKGGKKIDDLYPQKDFHYKSEQPMTEVKIRSTLKEDLYLVLSGYEEGGEATFHVFINPLVRLIWYGIGIMVLGGMFVLVPNKQLGPAVALKKSPLEEVRDKAA